MICYNRRAMLDSGTHHRSRSIINTVLLLAGLAASSSAKEKSGGDALADLLGRAKGRIAAGQADSAFSLLRQELFEEVQGMSQTSPHQLDERLTRGVVLTAQAAGKPWEGVSAIETVLPMRPGEVQLHLALGELEMGRARPEWALRHFERALLLDDHSADALGGFARARSAIGGIEPGKRYFDQLIQARPQEGAPRYGKGLLLLDADSPADAMTDLRWAIGLGQGEWRFERAYGQALALNGQRDDAVKAYQRALDALKKGGDPLMADRVASELAALKSGKPAGKS